MDEQALRAAIALATAALSATRIVEVIRLSLARAVPGRPDQRSKPKDATIARAIFAPPEPDGSIGFA